MIETAPDRAQRLRRIYAIARRPMALLALTHCEQQLISALSFDELQVLADAATLALKHERARGSTRHWSYDMNRHIAIKDAYSRIDAEIAARRHCRQRERKKPRALPRLREVSSGSN